jgi:hypothetical protein
VENFAAVAIHEVEAERGRPLAEPASYARPLLQVVRVSTRITVDEFPFQGSIDQDGS